jgi:hypothetical protein
LGEKVLLTCHNNDDSIPRLKLEFESSQGGAYKFDKKLNTDPATTESPSRPPLVLDVGGNLGFVSIAMAKLHKHAQIIVFEPNPFPYIYLRWNIFLNDIHVLTLEELDIGRT